MWISPHCGFLVSIFNEVVMDERTARMRRSPNYAGKTFRNRTEVLTMLPNSTLWMLRQQWAIVNFLRGRYW
jgi:hypothetical protein